MGIQILFMFLNIQFNNKECLSQKQNKYTVQHKFIAIIIMQPWKQNTSQGSPKDFFNDGANLRNAIQSLCFIHLKVENNED